MQKQLSMTTTLKFQALAISKLQCWGYFVCATQKPWLFNQSTRVVEKKKSQKKKEITQTVRGFESSV